MEALRIIEKRKNQLLDASHSSIIRLMHQRQIASPHFASSAILALLNAGLIEEIGHDEKIPRFQLTIAGKNALADMKNETKLG
jgi:hypothetical protein